MMPFHEGIIGGLESPSVCVSRSELLKSTQKIMCLI